MENFLQILDFFIHIDQTLLTLVSTYGALSYSVLFLIIFCETGLVIIPFLPGDSLLFAAGSIAALNNALDIQLLFLLLVIASILGNKLNYLCGRFLGPQIFSFQKSWLFNPKYLEKAHAFYQKHGGKAIIFARFLPIIRTFAPFVAGAAHMNLRSFSFYNAFSAILWIGSLLSAGYFLGQISFVKEHFSLMIYAIVILSLTPPIFTFAYQKISKGSSV